MCEPHFTESAIFCLEVASKNGINPTEIWVLGDDVPQGNSISRWFPDAKIRNLMLDNKKWPLDVGSNQMLQLPMTLYAAIQETTPQHIILPLNRASAYFALMARKGGLLNADCKITQTCYLPTSFTSEGSLILPIHLSTVLNTELETWCAQNGDTLWITYGGLRRPIAEQLGIPISKIKTLPLTEPTTSPPVTNHIVFAGPPTPLYGFDAFLDLAENLADDLAQISVFLDEGDHTFWQQSGFKRLHALKAKLNWHRGEDIYNHRDKLTDAVLICPMRTHLFPLAARAVQKTGMRILWGTGFELPTIKVTKNVYPVISDVRKLKAKLLEIWNIRTPDKSLIKPAKLNSIRKLPKQGQKQHNYTAIKQLSIILLHHNRPNFIDQTLASLAAQTDMDFELVLVDDGSQKSERDMLPDLVAKHGFKNFQISTIENSYPSVARNHGAAIAKGDALLFIDDDNLLAPETIKAFKAALANQDIVLSFFQTFSGEKMPTISKGLGMHPAHTSLAYGFAGLLPGTGLFLNIVGNSFFMIRKKMFENLGGYSPKYGIGLEDYAFILKAAMTNELNYVVLPEPYLHFRLHGDKIRNTHIDWRSPERLQAGHWRIANEIAKQTGNIPAPALAYARQLHELTQYQYVAKPRPKYFRLRSVLLHQYLRPFLARRQGLRKLFLGFAGKEGRLFRLLERWMGK